MNPKVEVVKLNIQKKGHQVGICSVKLVIEGGFEVTLPGMRIVEGSKGTFVDVPSRKFKDVGFVPHFYLNKVLKDLIAGQVIDAYEFTRAGKEIEKVKATPEQAAVAKLPVGQTKPMAPAKPWVKKPWVPNTVRK